MRGYNSTIIRKKKTCKRCGKPSYIFSQGRCQPCATIEDTLAREEEMIESEAGLPELISDLDALVSKYVRRKAADKDGLVQCYTCPTVLPVAEMQAGHYIPRGNQLLRFDVDRNIRPQCHSCNCLYHGRIAEYGKRLEEEMPNVTEVLLEESRIVHRWGRDELKSMINEYTIKLKQLNK
jgi:hypothetical protein